LKIVALDLSSHSGVAYFDSKQPQLLIDAFDYSISYKTPIATETKKQSGKVRYNPKGRHPYDFIDYVEAYTFGLYEKVMSLNADIVVIEQTNKGRDRWRQKLLEWLHFSFCQKIRDERTVHYIDTREWRNLLNLKVSRDQKSANRRIRKHNKEAKINKELKRLTGITNQKKLAIQFAEDMFDITMRAKDNDIADAICIGYAYLLREKIIHE
jgi:hypothetical protein